MPTDANVAARVRAWLQDVVVGLDLCPFAAGPMRRGAVRIAVSEATDAESALTDLWLELDRLFGTATETVETTLLALPAIDQHDFEGLVHLTEVAEAVADRAGYADLVQIIAFHPNWCAAGAPPDDPANATNRSPVPMLHLLREASVSRAIDSHPDPLGIPARNAELLRGLDPTTLRALTLGHGPTH